MDTVIAHSDTSPGTRCSSAEQTRRLRFRTYATGWMIVVWIIFCWWPAASIADSTSDTTLEVGTFSHAQEGEEFPTGWEPLTFDKIKEHTRYELVKDNDQVVVKATSVESSSGLTRPITIDPKEFPIVSWRWKVENVFKNGDVTKKDGDDYPARIYITFIYDSTKVGLFEKAKYEAARLLYGQYPPLAAINYIWASKSPVGTVVPNPYTDRVQMFVIQSGEDRLGKWVTEERNVYEDYKRAFGQEPPMISGVALMTDTDNTKEAAIAYYGDITFKKKQ
ncbi:MAG: DUF3047 domain-containing protein [Nitrospirales bacterium]|nr:DUF3047 domain-containing protein [Nitrospirales bacterium]